MDAAEETLAVARVRAWLRTGRARAVREQARLSQSDVARVVGTDTSRVSRWEAGKAVPHRGSALVLARLYDELERLAADGEARA